MDLQLVRDNIIGYSTKINTPFGQRCQLYADNTTTGRPFKQIEDIIAKLKPLTGNSNNESSEVGEMSTSLMQYAERSILKSHGVTGENYFAIPTGNGSTSALAKTISILKLKEKTYNQTFEKGDTNQPIVFITPYEPQSNVLPWLQINSSLNVVDSDENGNIDYQKFQQTLISYRTHKIIIVSFSALSQVTSQATNI